MTLFTKSSIDSGATMVILHLQPKYRYMQGTRYV